jgi:hypothetical protein
MNMTVRMVSRKKTTLRLMVIQKRIFSIPRRWV